MTRLTLMIAVAVVFAGCGGDGSRPPATDPHDEFSANWDRMEESTEWQQAYDRYHECLGQMGYPSTDAEEGVVVLKDGTIYRHQSGESSGAWLQFQVDSETCSDQSGITEVRAVYGTLDPTPNAGQARANNEYGTLQMKCMAERGWTIPEPQTLRGMLVWPVTFADDEERQAFTLDQVGCNMELFGTPGYPY